jgi:hypothetical protein
MSENDVRRTIYITLAAFIAFLFFWFAIVYISACGFTLNCIRGAPLTIRTPVPTLIPAVQAVEPEATSPAEFNQCQVGTTDLIAAWVMAGHTEDEPFPFTDLNGQDCQATFTEDVQPLFVENSLWFPGSLGCTSCHNAELDERSGGLDLSSYEAISLGTRRVAGSTSPGTDLFGRGEWENSLLYETLVNQGFTPQGHSPDAPPRQAIIYAGQPVVATQVPPTPSPTATAAPEETTSAETTATPTPTP